MQTQLGLLHFWQQGDMVTQASANPELHLRADRATRYEKLADIMAAAQRAGITRIAFVTDPTRP